MSSESDRTTEGKRLEKAAVFQNRDTRHDTSTRNATRSPSTFTPRDTPLGQVDNIMELVRTSRITEAEILLRLYWPPPDEESSRNSRVSEAETRTEPWRSVVSVDRQRPTSSAGSKQPVPQRRRSKDADRDTGQQKSAEQMFQQRSARRTGATK